MTLEDKLKELILSDHATIKDFADKCGIKYQTVMSILTRGVLNASVTNIIKICQTLGISTDELANGRIVAAGPSFTMKERTALEEVVTLTKQRMNEGRLTFEGVPLSEDEKDFLSNTMDVCINMMKSKRLDK